ncbi:C-C motif chemokine 20 [Gasterosteus aculeatus]|uniref:C-C motif chemokine 20-like n=1 Tax=Gasterosteus aculeatus aculeatus TaxID=481459 RepID=UPI001A98937D|nr:C-C motif chemokine 20-like [Gasterosteus aculeatus aculeatus]
MTFSRVLAALLCFTAWVSVVHATHASVSSCCLGWSTRKVPPRCVVNYTVQTDAACSINAIVFRHINGGRICSDPNSDWAKQVILKVNREKRKQSSLQENGQNEDGTTSAVSPAVSLPSKTTLQKTSRNRRGCQRKKPRAGKRGQN